MKRLYYPAAISEITVLKDAEHHYLKNVLRMDAGSIIELLTPYELASVEITEINKREAKATLIKKRPLCPVDYSFTVYQCVLKREYMDNVIEKYTELGVSKIIPVLSARSIGDVKDTTLNRYREIAKSAVLQSEREHMPEITEAVKIDKISIDPAGENLLFYERKEEKESVSLTKRNIQIIIGPEGGFSDDEADMLIKKGFRSISPIKNILKAETAAVVFAGWVQIQLDSL